MGKYVLDLDKACRAKSALVGGKAANLAELAGIPGILVPAGFCVTTDAYVEMTHLNPNLQGLLHELSRANALEQEHLRAITALIRSSIEQGPVPEGMAVEVAARLDRFAGHTAFAVRSSATAEDLPTASFAGQQDSYLNIMGTTSVMQHIRRCWASLFTDRAVTYRMRNGFDHLSVRLAVIVQKMILPQAAGIMFTADPLTGNRKILSIEAVTGLADALVSGARNADSFKVHSGTVVDKRIAASHQEPAVLTDEDVIRLEMAGRKIEAHFNYPQDIEWCLGDALYIVQSRPITTLFPIPEVPDHKKHVFISVGHQQMMTDPMKPLGLSLWKLIAFRPMASAGGRLFVDVTASLFSPSARSALIQAMAAHDPLIEDALLTVVGRPDLIDSDSDNQDRPNPAPTSASSAGYPKIDPSLISELIGASRQSIEKLRNSIGAKCGPALFDFILEDIRELKQKIAGSQTLRIITAATHASSWLNDHMKAWLNEPRVADTLSQSVPNNVTAEMGLALMDVADVIRPYPELIDCLRRAGEGTFLRELLDLKGGRPARDAILRYLDKYGMRCPGEIDITRPRWAEQPAALIPMILSNVSNLESGEAKRKFEAGREQALKREGDLLERLKQLPDSDRKMEETRRMIDLLRNTAGYREYPKYDIVNHLFLYKQALMREAYQLAKNGLIREKEDIFYLTFDELREVVRTGRLDNELIALRKAEHAGFERLTPPRVITSDGEIISGKYRRDGVPAEAIPGLPVSSGVVEGRARVIRQIEDASLREGDILVTVFTDPGWTPAFVSIKGLVTEVGGLMTHGAVIAREYGLPAVVGVLDATRLIRDGQRIRVNGTEGYIEVL